jgi:hypothetical protein
MHDVKAENRVFCRREQGVLGTVRVFLLVVGYMFSSYPLPYLYLLGLGHLYLFLDRGHEVVVTLVLSPVWLMVTFWGPKDPSLQ